MNIFVFGSNLSGIHGKGAANHALRYKKAIWGNGVGLQGESYAIPTKDKDVKTPLPLNKIKEYVNEFIIFVHKNEDKYTFEVTNIGCGYAGYSANDIAPMFTPLVNNPNVNLTHEFSDVIFQKNYRNIFEY